MKTLNLVISILTLTLLLASCKKEEATPPVDSQNEFSGLLKEQINSGLLTEYDYYANRKIKSWKASNSGITQYTLKYEYDSDTIWSFYESFYGGQSTGIRTFKYYPQGIDTIIGYDIDLQRHTLYFFNGGDCGYSGSASYDENDVQIGMLNIEYIDENCSESLSMYNEGGEGVLLFVTMRDDKNGWRNSIMPEYLHIGDMGNDIELRFHDLDGNYDGSRYWEYEFNSLNYPIRMIRNANGNYDTTHFVYY